MEVNIKEIYQNIHNELLYPLVKGYIVFGEKYVTGRRKRLRPYRVGIFRITSLVDLAISVSPSVCVNAVIAETIKGRQLGIQI